VLAHDGETMGNGPVLQMGDTGAMYVVAEVSELSIPALERAQRVQIKALGKDLDGTIEPNGVGWVIGKNAVFSLNPTEDADRRVVEVKIRLDDAARSFAEKLTNLQVDVVMTPGPHRGPAVAGRPGP
jgi:HlyD family secretion protein